jgi:hypothetical protein
VASSRPKDLAAAISHAIDAASKSALLLQKNKDHITRMTGIMCNRAGAQEPPGSASVELDFVGSQIPCLTEACIETLTKPISVGEAWNQNISWTYAARTATVKAKAAAAPEPPVKEGTVKNLKVTDQTFAGLSRLADRLGFVHGARGEHPFSPNVSALLRGLATGEVFLPGTPLHRTMSATSASQADVLTAYTKEVEKHLSAAVDVLQQLKTVLQDLRKCTGSAPGNIARCFPGHHAESLCTTFHETYFTVLDHPSNEHQCGWPNKMSCMRQPDFCGPFEQMARPWALPADILDVWPETLRHRVAAAIRRKGDAVLRPCIEELGPLWGFNTKADGCAALAWQCANQRSRSLAASMSHFVHGVSKCKHLLRRIFKAASSEHENKRELYRDLFPKPRQEVLMMAATGTTYRSRTGYKRIMPWRAWPGSSSSVATKHCIYNDVQAVLKVSSTPDGWCCSPRAVLELEYEALLAEGSVDPPAPGMEHVAPLHVTVKLDGRKVSKKGGEVEACLNVVLVEREPFRSQAAQALRTFAIWQGVFSPSFHPSIHPSLPPAKWPPFPPPPNFQSPHSPKP